jgi:hypothetical protein
MVNLPNISFAYCISGNTESNTVNRGEVIVQVMTSSKVLPRKSLYGLSGEGQESYEDFTCSKKGDP